MVKITIENCSKTKCNLGQQFNGILTSLIPDTRSAHIFYLKNLNQPQTRSEYIFLENARKDAVRVAFVQELSHAKSLATDQQHEIIVFERSTSEKDKIDFHVLILPRHVQSVTNYYPSWQMLHHGGSFIEYAVKSSKECFLKQLAEMALDINDREMQNA